MHLLARDSSPIPAAPRTYAGRAAEGAGGHGETRINSFYCLGEVPVIPEGLVITGNVIGK
ncbi:hypothetical protein D3C81_1960400 [compost metagenome]